MEDLIDGIIAESRREEEKKPLAEVVMGLTGQSPSGGM
jgi:hypothetical protein